MVTVNNLQEVPTVEEFCSKIQQKEKTLEWHEVSSYDYKLYPNSTPKIGAEATDMLVGTTGSEQTRRAFIGRR